MKLRGVRVGERFVFDHVGGVWTKVSETKARCIYGKNFRKEESLDPNVSVYVIFEDKTKDKLGRTIQQEGTGEDDVRPCGEVPVSQKQPCSIAESRMPEQKPADVFVAIPEGTSILTPGKEPMPVTNLPSFIRLLLVDENEKVLTEIPAATSAQIAAYTQAEEVKLPNSPLGRRVEEILFDHGTQTLYVVLENM